MGAGGNGAHYLALRELLEPWSPLWGHSVLRGFEAMESRVPEEWFRYGADAGIASQYAIGQGDGDDRAPESLKNWVGRIRALCELPGAGAPSPVRPSFARRLNPKKRHEIEAVLGFLKGNGGSIDRILDIGGGVGHLARHLALELECPVESVDRDEALQRAGARIQERSPWREALKQPVRFTLGSFPSAGDSRAGGGDGWAIGLHTCGALAWSQLELALKGSSVLNVGCCYEKLDLATDTQRSAFVREHPLPWTDEALFLANRGGVERPPEGFAFQQRVLRHRYALALLMEREGCGIGLIDAVGTASDAAYSGSFAGYARDRWVSLEGVPVSLSRLSDSALEDFRGSVEREVEKRRFVAFLRNLLARPLEIGLLLDRALFAEERAVPARAWLVQLFDPRISPRNVGLAVRV